MGRNVGFWVVWLFQKFTIPLTVASSYFRVFSQPGVAGRCSVCLRPSLPPFLRGAVYSGGEKPVTENHAILVQLHPIRVSGRHVPASAIMPPSLPLNTLHWWTPSTPPPAFVVTCHWAPCLSPPLLANLPLCRLTSVKGRSSHVLPYSAACDTSRSGFPELSAMDAGAG